MCVVDLVQATASGTAAFFKRAQQCATGGPLCASRPLFARMPRTGLSLSRTTFGGDNVGASTGERSRAMWAALKSRRCNTVLINLNELADRRRPTSPMFARDGTSQLWEAHVLHEAMERRLIAREEAVVVANVMLDDLSLPSSALPSRVPASELPALVASALHWMGLPSFDVLLVHLPSSPTEFSPVTHLPAVISSLEGQVAKGAIGSYGFSCSSFSAAEDGSGNSSSSSSSEGGDAVGQPVWKIMGVVESVLQDHHLSCLAYDFNLGNLQPMHKLFAGEEGGSTKPRGVSDLVRSYGVFQFGRRPLDLAQGRHRFRLSTPSPLQPDQTGDAIAKALNESFSHVLHLEAEFDSKIVPMLRAKATPPPGSTAPPGLPSEQDGTWGRILASCVNDFESLCEWEGLLHFNIGRSVETLTRYTSAFEETKNWSIAYRVSILKLMDDFSAVMRFRHEGQMAHVSRALLSACPAVSSALAPGPGSPPVPLESVVSQLLVSAGVVDTVCSEAPGVFMSDWALPGDVSREHVVEALQGLALPALAQEHQ